MDNMRSKTLLRWLAAAGATTLASLASAQIRISEIHYDNAGTDAGEAIEVSAPAGTDLSGWTVVLYNGSNGQSYDTDFLPASVVPATCGARGVLVINYPANGIQNGAPDAIALVDTIGAVREFISYEGVFAATNGPALGMTSTDIGALQNGSEAIGLSLQRDAAGVWALANSTFGACNDDGGTQPPDPEVASIVIGPNTSTMSVGATRQFNATAFDTNNQPINNVSYTWTSSQPSIATVSGTGLVTGIAAGDSLIRATAPNGVSGVAIVTVQPVVQPPASEFHINEIHYDNLGTDAGEAIEIEGPSGASIQDFTLVLYNGSNSAPYGTPMTLSGVLPTSCTNRGVVVVTYPQDGIQNGSPDAIALVNAAGEVVEFVSYEGVLTGAGGPANGLTSVDIGVSQTNAAAGLSLQRGSTGVWSSGISTFGQCNGDTPIPQKTIVITGRDPNDDVPLPVGYEDQIFAQLRENGANVPSTFTWTSETPDIATIDADGVFRALAVGSARFRATAADGTTSTITLPTRIAVASATALYANNAEFGEPSDADPSDDLIVRRPQFTSSYSPVRNSPNWVAYEIDPTHFGAEDRCDCFTMDPELPSSLLKIDTNDYTGSGAIAGHGIDRGHLARSFDRTSGSLDNATTFLLTNIIPQTADQNQGPWAQMENDLGAFVRSQGKEVYVIAGVAGNKGTLKNEGKVIIPTHTWKVALVLPHDQGLADIRDYRDVQAIAVVMPNEPGIRNVPWQTYLTTVDSVETLSGYDLLALLPDAIETAVESNTQPPIVAISGPAGALAEGDSTSFSAAGSIDPNGSIVSYEWEFGDGSVGTGVAVTHTFAQDGVFTVRLTATDDSGLVSTATFAVTVSNVLPTVGAVANGSVNVGVAYTASGSFSDPGADAWTATVNWGDGSAAETVALSGQTFTLTHAFGAAGTYTVAIAIADDDGSTTVTHTVTVTQPAPALGAALPLIDQLVAAKKMPLAVGLAFKIQIVAAQQLITRGSAQTGKVLLQATVVELDLLARLRVVKATDVAPLRAVLVSAIASL
jgi:DNA/RNA endonuclease G (NUC1)